MQAVLGLVASERGAEGARRCAEVAITWSLATETADRTAQVKICLGSTLLDACHNSASGKMHQEACIRRAQHIVLFIDF